MARILEYSEDRRGDLPHIARAIDEIRSLGGHGTRCTRCGQRNATHLSVDLRMATCDPCAREWASMSPEARRERRCYFERGAR